MKQIQNIQGRITLYKLIWCKIRLWQNLRDIPDYLLHLIMQQPHKSDTDFIIPHSRKSVYSKFKRLMAKHDIDMTFHNLRR